MGKLRIIAGEWRSRRLSFPDTANLRPTPDAVRETLFNWLAGSVVDSRCLDLFAGSGALGFEAISRGAQSAVLVECNPQAAAGLRDNVEILGCQSKVRVRQLRADRFLNSNQDKFDIVFLDPPFDTPDLGKILHRLPPHLADQATIYIETAKNTPLPLPETWHIIRQANHGMVISTLVRQTH